MNYIELFAGCGGLSLGLKSIGFNMLMANELSPMASESYAFNFFQEDLRHQADAPTQKVNKTLWLSSNYNRAELKQRLREDPRTFPSLDIGNSDIAADGSNLKGSLVVGSIVTLNDWLKDRPDVAKQLRSGFGDGGVDLISGGPPCQSFSMAGLRKKDCEKNALPWEFAKLVQTVQPRLVILENVTGILRPFKDEKGHSYCAWFELAKAFSMVGYVPLCLHVNAKLAGVPQNRPRFILLGVRKNFFDQISNTFNDHECELFAQPLSFYGIAKDGGEVDLSELDYRDVKKNSDLVLFQNSFLKPLVSHSDSYVSVMDAIDDLRKNGDCRAYFSKFLLKTFNQTLPKRDMKNHELRANGGLVSRRFRLYQVLAQVDTEARKEILSTLKGASFGLSDSTWLKVQPFSFLVDSGGFVNFINKEEFVAFLLLHQTKKQTQKALIAHQPAPAALSIADDACHYHHDEQRTLTVREMARIQSFPDNFEFRSKVTTGGTSRRYEVPQYTQVGNAVPPLLGRALGLVVANLLERSICELPKPLRHIPRAQTTSPSNRKRELSAQYSLV